MRKYFSLVTMLFIMSNLLFGYFTISGYDILDNDGNKIMLRGLGLGGWLVPEGYMLHLHPGEPAGSPTTIRNRIVELVGEEKAKEFYAEYLKNYVTKEDIQEIADQGYNHIRLPFNYKFLDPDTTSPIFVEDGYEMIDQCLQWCKDAGLYVILDMHCAPGGQSGGNISDSDGNARLWSETKYQDKIVKIWNEIAERYAEEEWIIGYDLINEPVVTDGYSGINLRQVYVKIRNELRKVDNNHIIFIEGNWYASDFSSLDPIFDTKMAYSFHKYWSHNDKASLQAVLNLRQKTNVPLWLGETGENSNHWFREMVELVENNNIGWCNWTHKKFETTTSHYSAYLPDNWSLIQDGNPSQSLAFEILMEFADNLKSDKCRINPGVTPGYLDENFLTTHRPMKEHNIPGVIQATDYDIGGNGVAYLDNDYYKHTWDGHFPWNTGYEYRNDGVDIQKTDDSKSNGFNVGWTGTGEWMKYTVNVNEQGTYNINIRVASAMGGKIQLFQNDYDITGLVNVPNTGGWDKWQTMSIDGVYLSKGKSIIKLKIAQESYNLSKIDFQLVATSIEQQPEEFILVGENYPNPFNGSTVIPIEIAGHQKVKLQIYDIKGNLVNTLLDSGIHGKFRAEWNGTDFNGNKVSTGTYFYRAQIGNDVIEKKMIFLK